MVLSIPTHWPRNQTWAYEQSCSLGNLASCPFSISLHSTWGLCSQKRNVCTRRYSKGFTKLKLQLLPVILGSSSHQTGKGRSCHPGRGDQPGESRGSMAAAHKGNKKAYVGLDLNLSLLPLPVLTIKRQLQLLRPDKNMVAGFSTTQARRSGLCNLAKA